MYSWGGHEARPVYVRMPAFLKDLREALVEQSQYHELLYQMARRDLLLRYKQTVLGFAWAIFTPLVNTIIFSVVFTRVAPIETPVPYPIFAYCGLLVWNFTAASLRFSVNALTANAMLVGKVYFPRELLPLSAILVSLVDLAVGALLLVGLCAYYGVVPSWTLVALPALLIIQIAFTTALALLLSMANLFFRDVKYLFDVVINVWMFATAVVYPADALEGRLRVLLEINPMTPIVESYRAVVLLGDWPPASLGIWALLVFLLLAVATVVFHRAEDRFAESV
ncbi:MAG: ABC transporter permease [Acidimicrobiia bacterium]|nr:ABC transporter permease [Acidimicrobiia bacterium]